MELKDLGVSPQTLKIFWKKFSKTFIKTQLHCVFRNKIISYVIKICLFQILPNKISLALILKRKSCICCCKHCIAYFRRHMECAVLKRFLKVQGTFSIKKFLQITLSIWKKLNLIRFIKTLIKRFTPHPLRSAPSPQGEGFKTLPSSYACHLPFQGRLSNWLLIR